MAFAGHCGVAVDLPVPPSDPHCMLAALFAEELGWVLEVSPDQKAAVLAAYAAARVPCTAIGATGVKAEVEVKVGGTAAITGTTPLLRDLWESTSFQLETLQCAEECVEAEAGGLSSRVAPTWRLPYTPSWTPPDKLAAEGRSGSLACSRVLRKACSAIRCLRLPN
jgi:phosphoribosylformylglycinamidine synthase